MADGERFIINEDSIKTLSRERQRLLMAFRVLLTPILGDMTKLLHTMQSVQPNESFEIEIVTDCGFKMTLRVDLDSLGVCKEPDRERKVKELVKKAEALLKRNDGTAFHGVSKARSVSDVLDIIKEKVEQHRKHTKPEQSAALDEVERMIDDAISKNKNRKEKPSTPKPPKPPSPQDLGFLS